MFSCEKNSEKSYFRLTLLSCQPNEALEKPMSPLSRSQQKLICTFKSSNQDLKQSNQENDEFKPREPNF